MSHIVVLRCEVRDATAVRAACQRLGLSEPVQNKAKLFSGEVEGLAVQLPNWAYPVVCDTNSGTLRYDNFNERWGDSKELDKFLQMYAVEKSRLEARRRGHQVTEQTVANGSIKLTIQVADAV